MASLNEVTCDPINRFYCIVEYYKYCVITKYNIIPTVNQTAITRNVIKGIK